jgi:hypothetical protein
MHPFRDLHQAVTLPFTALFTLAICTTINWITSPGHWWVQWPALGLGIAWLISLARVARAVVLAGGLAAVAAILMRRR